MIKYLLTISFCLLISCGKQAPPSIPEVAPERIISLAPNITDTLYDLGLEQQLVGVSRFSGDRNDRNLPVVGDFMQVSYEKIVSLNPDLVILEKSSDDQKARLNSLGIPYLETGSLSLDEVLTSIELIGDACQVQEQAEELAGRFRTKVRELQNNPGHRPRTLVAFSDFSGADKVEQVYAFGSGCIHSELLDTAGGENVVADNRPSVTLSREAVIRLNPELIIELSTGGPTNDWNSLPTVNAVQNNNIHVLTNTYTTIPSPSCLLKTLEDFSVIIRQNDFVAE